MRLYLKDLPSVALSLCQSQSNRCRDIGLNLCLTVTEPIVRTIP
ncbi:MAG: hypothetical protein ACI9FD_004368 [Gammaproteobacteria bacterium]